MTDEADRVARGLTSLALRVPETRRCTNCRGSGWWSTAEHTPRGGYSLSGGPCAICGGSGLAPRDKLKGMEDE
jgi:DnaJ-class molecular chaperone